MPETEVVNQTHTNDSKTTFSIQHLSVTDWIEVADYPYLSNDRIDKNAASPHWQALTSNPAKAVNAYLSIVSAACLNGSLVKIDGSTRSVLWKANKLPAPQTVTVVVYEVATLNELTALYDFVQKKQRHSTESIMTLYEELGIRLTSKRMKFGFITEALNIALRGKPRDYQDKRSFPEEIDLRKALRLFQPQLQQLDRLNPDPTIFLTGVIASALILLSLDDRRIEFYKALNQRHVEQRDERVDPPGSILKYLDTLRNQKSGQAKIQIGLCGRVVRAISAWEKGPEHPYYWLKQTIQTQEFAASIRAFKKAQSISRDPQL